jgi:hypothetical protein
LGTKNPKGINRITNIVLGHMFLREEKLGFNDINYMI